jgi:ADP-heptose:LPS heptosyltransferase
MTKILVYRFSAMGDVILLLPVIKGVLDSNRDVEIYLLTQPSLFPIFQNIDRLHLIAAELKGKHSGLNGLFKLYRKIRKKINPSVVIDVHCVLRTYLLDLFFGVCGFRLILFKKGTFRKMKLIKSKSLRPLHSTVERYSDAFMKAGFNLKLPNPPLFDEQIDEVSFSTIFKNSLLIGIAPFAKHEQKVWGVSKVEKLIGKIHEKFNAHVILFGGGKSELKILNQIEAKYPDCIVAANHFSFTDEIKLMRKLSVMVSMDSANMHLASIAGVPTVSIWGATHPALGFAPYHQAPENIIQYEGDQLSCRPCSVYGNKKCIFPDGIRCMKLISEDVVFQRINQILSEKNTAY